MYGVARGIDPDTPGQYLMQALFDIGPSRYEGGSELPVQWSEVAAYANLTGTLAEPWEQRAVMTMSRAYVSERNAGKDPLRIAPIDRGRE